VKAPLWVVVLADEFWKATGLAEPFPRSLRQPIVRVFTGPVVHLAAVRLRHVQAWLAQRSIPCPCTEPDRPLRACLVAHSGGGVIFIDASDPEDEHRFSLAHELAHWLLEYWQPRRLASAQLGERVLDVFDGKRPPTVAEQLHALIRQVRLGFHLHLMERNRDGSVGDRRVAAAEQQADRLAFELLAPAREVACGGKATPWNMSALTQQLQVRFGLAAADYSTLLLPAAPPADPVLARLWRKA
jgi:hypothetical protein